MLALLVACLPFRDGGAQTLLTGRVMSSGQPVAGAEVIVAPHDVIATTSDDGTYRIHLPAPGQVRVSVRVIGFEPATRRLILAATDSTVVDFALIASVQRLAPVEVAGLAERRSAKMVGFEQRRRFNLGTFITRADLADQEQRMLSNVLRNAAGIQLVPLPRGGFAAASGRGPPSLTRGTGSDPSRCYMTVFLDGMMLPGSPNVDGLRVEELEAVEIYRGGSQTPIEFNMVSSNCGVLVLWTRVGGE
jgi:hypothetical protein